jgi:hypothetical protein
MTEVEEAANECSTEARPEERWSNDVVLDVTSLAGLLSQGR